jgi:hypothetical protein
MAAVVIGKKTRGKKMEKCFPAQLRAEPVPR